MEPNNHFESTKHSNFANVPNTGFTKFGDRFANVTIGKDLNVPMYKDLSFFPVLQDGNCALSAIMCQMAEYSHLNFHEKIDFKSMKLNPSKKNKDILKKEQSKKEIQFGIRSIMCDIYEFILHNCRRIRVIRNEYKHINNIRIENNNTDPDFFKYVIDLKSNLSNFKKRIGYKGDDNYLIDSIKSLYSNINPIIEEKKKIYNSFEKAFDNYKEEMLDEKNPLYLNEVDILLLSLIFNCPISIFFYEKVNENILFIEEKLFKEEEEKKKEESKIIRIGIKTRNYNGTSITQSHYDAILVRPEKYTTDLLIEQIPRSDDALLHAICRAYEIYEYPYYHIANDFKEVMKEYLKSDDSKGITKRRYFVPDDVVKKIKEDIENDIHVYGTYGEFEYEMLAEFLETKNCNISFYKASNSSYKNDFIFNEKDPIIHILHFDDAIITNKLETIPHAGPPSIQRDFAVIYHPNELEMQKQEIIRTGTNDMSRKIIGKRANEIAANTGGPNNLNFSNIIDSRQIMMNRFGERRERLDEINKEFLKTNISDEKRNSLKKEKKYLEKLPIEEETKKDVEELQNYIYKGRLNETDIYYPANEIKPERTEKFSANTRTRKILNIFKGKIKRKMTQKMTQEMPQEMPRKTPIFRRLFGPS